MNKFNHQPKAYPFTRHEVEDISEKIYNLENKILALELDLQGFKDYMLCCGENCSKQIAELYVELGSLNQELLKLMQLEDATYDKEEFFPQEGDIPYN